MHGRNAKEFAGEREQERALTLMKVAVLLLLMLLSTVPLAACSQSEQQPNAATVQTQDDQQEAGEEASSADVPNEAYISIEDAAALMEKQECFVMDIRVLSAYDSVHIDGAISMPKSTIDIRIREVPTDKTVMIVAQQEEGTAEARQILIDNGIDPASILIIQGGMDSWAANDLPMVSVQKYRC